MPRRCISLLISFLLVYTYSSSVSAQVVINEVLPNPSGDDSGAEWVELYNSGSEPKSLNDCILYLHSSDNYQNVAFGDEDFIDKFKVISWDDSWLNNSGDQVRFICGGATEVVAYGESEGSVIEVPDEGVTFGRNPNGTGSYFILAQATMGETNSLPPTPTPTLSPEPTNTPKPTPTPKPTSTPKPTNTPTPKPTLKAASIANPTVTVKPEITIGEGSAQGEVVLGVKGQVSATPTTENKEGSKGKFPLTAGLFILGGISFIGLAAYPVIKNRKKSYNKNGDSKTEKELS